MSTEPRFEDEDVRDFFASRSIAASCLLEAIKALTKAGTRALRPRLRRKNGEPTKADGDPYRDLLWVLSDAEEVWSFRFCCERLGYDPKTFRDVLRRDGVLLDGGDGGGCETEGRRQQPA